MLFKAFQVYDANALSFVGQTYKRYVNACILTLLNLEIFLTYDYFTPNE